MLKLHILILLFLNIVFVVFLCGCYSALHHAQVIDGPSAAFAYRPLHDELWVGGIEGLTSSERFESKSSAAFRYGWAASKMGDPGASLGLLVHQFAFEDDSDTLVIGDGFIQAPKNSSLDLGIGIQLGGILEPDPFLSFFNLYAAIGRNIGTGSDVYCELQLLPLAVTLGIQFRVIRNLSLFTEANIVSNANGAGRVLAVGLVIHGAQERVSKVSH